MSWVGKFRRWLGRLIAGDGEFVPLHGGIGYPGSVATLTGLVHRAASDGLPVGISLETGYRCVNDLAPGRVRIVVERCR
jgi:hypothetical protein